ncbi:MAG: hypothetical protein KKA07_07445 [Bacteroidetes bacterium]|nr:hypothetical protein [Bacteroidota bacterium]MBU1718895.1 hypothetical protein [Bacteroidota bacterium]
MKKTALILLAVFFCSIGFNSVSYGQDSDKDVVVIKSKDVVKTRNASSNIKVKAPTEDANPIAAPSIKGGTASESECTLVFDNFTGFFVEIYVDGVYKGTVGAWGALTIYNSETYKKVYCITTGGSKDWLLKGKYDGTKKFRLE